MLLLFLIFQVYLCICSTRSGPAFRKWPGSTSRLSNSLCAKRRSLWWYVRACVYACDCACMCVYFDILFGYLIIFNFTDLRAYHLPCTLPSTPTYFLNFHYFFFSIYNILFSSTPHLFISPLLHLLFSLSQRVLSTLWSMHPLNHHHWAATHRTSSHSAL